ncbi:MAG: retroviral-like aspartic protease family protein [Bryobacterales bacterium]|nr:retroviral-like aspartic protease family protein [Bryobacterales bacterium]
MAAVAPDQWNEANNCPELDAVRSDIFVFDTGADITLISRPLALDLGLDLTPPAQPQSIGTCGLPMVVVHRKVRILLQSEWMEIDCVVPVSPFRDENLLGMRGLIDRFRFEFDKKRLVIED